ncbi:t-SNARE [Punctularia strigosozonata HHB-11173 SS5]|uniref:t-SNARE n=1 Tax=Punctularia strigosozonata (strain HHB-11173) TaxID=741275 RepID=UPI0004416BE1|nr:t-SNARE [Punctularia strigosozonata HHB-11173 SS5]EIN07486.1 t-SNARE [Punctularia strigosozonata HHB-11173 SS5]
MTGLHQPAPGPTVINGNGSFAAESAPVEGLAGFQQEVGSIQDQIREFEANVARISELHSVSLNAMDEAATRQNLALLDDQVAQTRTLSNAIKLRIQALTDKPTAGVDKRLRKNQLTLISNKFRDALQNYQNVERDYRKRYKERVERQFKIVKPDATAEEVAAVVNDDSGGQSQIFAQALANSERWGESRAAYREVQERHEEIRRIEQTMGELAQLFNDMSVLINQQQEQIDIIEQTTEGVSKDAEAGTEQVEKAVKHARAARRKRWICFWLTLLLLAIVAIVVAVVVTQNTHH